MRKSIILLNNFGLSKTLLYLGIAFLQRCFFFRIYRILTREEEALPSVFGHRETAGGKGDEVRDTCVRPLSELEQDALAKQPEYDLDEEFLCQVRCRHELCIGVCSSAKVLSYGWFGRDWARIDDVLQIHPGPRTIYLHKFFTLPEFRGRHFLWRLLSGFLEQANNDHDRLLAVVEIQNFSSLRGFARAGFHPVGWVVLLSKNNWNFFWVNRKVRALGVQIKSLKA